MPASLGINIYLQIIKPFWQLKQNPKLLLQEDLILLFILKCHAEDRRRMAKFYKQAFGLQSKMLGEENGNYTLVTTSEEVGKDGRPKERGIINGGFFEKSNDKPPQYPSVVIAANDIKKSMKKIGKAGGEVLGEPMEIPGFGMYVSFYDTEGNRVSIKEIILSRNFFQQTFQIKRIGKHL